MKRIRLESFYKDAPSQSVRAHVLILCFQRFLQRFIDPTSSEDENAGLDLNEPLYMQKLEEVEC